MAEKASLGVILNVNDDMVARYLVTKVLTKAGFTVREAEDGERALELVQDLPDLVVLDVRLPGIGGLEVCRRIKADPLTASIPVLHTSATFVSSERRVEGLEGGADGYLAQPFESIELVATVRSLLRARRAEDAVRATASDWQAAFDGISDGVCLLDPDGRVRRHNRAFLELLDAGAGPISERAGRPLLDALLDPSVRPIVRELLGGGRRTAEIARGERHLSIKCDALEKGKGWALVLADITEGKRIEGERRLHLEALAEASRRKDEFLAMLAHELRNPLNTISTAIHLQGLEGTSEDMMTRLRTTVGRQTDHLARLVDDLLDVSRITRGAIPLKREIVDLVKVVERALDASRVVLSARSQHLTLEAAGPVWVDGDALRLEQVVVNLLNNAAKYSEPGKRVQVSVQASAQAPGERGAVVKVRDEGRGIAVEMQSAIFDLFRQEEQALDRSTGGLGIGLTIVRSLVQMHGGEVGVRSEGRGRGAEFEVRLPLAQPPADAPAQPVPASPRVPGSRRVLVVEDNLEALELLQIALHRAGHTVLTASDGITGLELALSGRPDVAFVDVGLPGLDGYQLAQGVRADPRGDRIYLIALTGYGLPEDQARASQAGFDMHVIKPVNTARLLSLIGAAG